MKLCALFLAAAFGVGCSVPRLPSAPTEAQETSLIVLAGQSNAMLLTPYLQAAYTPVLSDAEGATSIDMWANNGRLWNPLVSLLEQHPRALVWWQGETDGVDHIAGYGAKLRDLISRARLTANDPSLLVVIVRVLPYPELAEIRAAEEAVVLSDRNAALVSVDAYLQPGPTNYHLSESGYRQTVQRILSAVAIRQ
jgi:hypothetical protein